MIELSIRYITYSKAITKGNTHIYRIQLQLYFFLAALCKPHHFIILYTTIRLQSP